MGSPRDMIRAKRGDSEENIIRIGGSPQMIRAQRGDSEENVIRIGGMGKGRKSLSSNSIL